MTGLPPSVGQPAIGATSLTGTAGGLANDTSRLTSGANLDKAGTKFEAIFISMMMKSMRQAKLGDGLFDSKAGEQFRDMQDAQFAQAMAEHAPMGIGKAVTEFLAKSKQGAAQGLSTPDTAKDDAA